MNTIELLSQKLKSLVFFVKSTCLSGNSKMSYTVFLILHLVY